MGDGRWEMEEGRWEVGDRRWEMATADIGENKQGKLERN
jgi:hypothetical protein